MHVFRWRDIAAGCACRPGSSRLRGPRAFPLHAHDFPEVFWVSRGRGRHIVNGTSLPLAPGSLVFIRSTDRHRFESDARGMLVHNVAFDPEILAHARRRYFPQNDALWGGDPTARIPVHHPIAPGRLAELTARIAQLASSPCGRIEADRFLLEVLASVQPNAAPAPAGRERPPSWLTDVLARWPGDPADLAHGTAGLARAAGRSPEHVSRTLMRHCGQTPTDWVNAARMRHAATRLRTTDRKVLDIALECGFESLGHFYAVFHKTHGCTPRQYRMRFAPRPI